MKFTYFEKVYNYSPLSFIFAILLFALMLSLSADKFN